MAARRFLGRGGPPKKPPAPAAAAEAEADWDYYDDSVQLSDFWQELVDTKSDENPVRLWLKLFERPDDNFEKFKEFWRIAVPRLLSPTPGKTSVDQTWDVKRINAVLLDTLESYIAGGLGCEEGMYKVRTMVLVLSSRHGLPLPGHHGRRHPAGPLRPRVPAGRPHLLLPRVQPGLHLRHVLRLLPVQRPHQAPASSGV
jgi:hypothetical protein